MLAFLEEVEAADAVHRDTLRHRLDGRSRQRTHWGAFPQISDSDGSDQGGSTAKPGAIVICTSLY